MIPTRSVVLILGLVAWANVIEAQGRAGRAREEIGQRLFAETELGNPGNDFSQSCNGCHALGEDPRGGGERFYTDLAEKSLLPGTGSQDPARTLRNTPMILDADLMERFYWDGRFASLEELLRAKLLSAHFGWQADERERAVANIQQMLVGGMLVDYAALFKTAYQVDVAELDAQEALDWIATALASFVENIVSEQTATWDAFAEINRIPSGPSRDEPPKHYAGRVHGRIGNQEGRVLIKRPIGFSEAAYEGFKTFFRVEGESSVGNCVTCHVPPAFSDHAFHNTGIAQVDYDQANGDGAFFELDVPGADAERPLERFLSDPRACEGCADLGRWSYAEADELDEALGAFKTPSLRNLGRTAPYMHNGAYSTLRETVEEIVRISAMARAGKMRAIDPEYEVMNLSESDVEPLTEFLESLDEVPVEEFRELLLTLEED